MKSQKLFHNNGEIALMRTYSDDSVLVLIGKSLSEPETYRKGFHNVNTARRWLEDRGFQFAGTL